MEQESRNVTTNSGGLVQMAQKSRAILEQFTL
jgi:hypothetical protein